MTIEAQTEVMTIRPNYPSAIAFCMRAFLISVTVVAAGWLILAAASLGEPGDLLSKALFAGAVLAAILFSVMGVFYFAERPKEWRAAPEGITFCRAGRQVRFARWDEVKDVTLASSGITVVLSSQPSRETMRCVASRDRHRFYDMCVARAVYTFLPGVSREEKTGSGDNA
jgi:hypothetical protein